VSLPKTDLAPAAPMETKTREDECPRYWRPSDYPETDHGSWHDLPDRTSILEAAKDIAIAMPGTQYW